MKAEAKSMTAPYMAALAALDERQEEVQVFVSPLGDQSTEIDAAAETAAFVARPDPARGVELWRADCHAGRREQPDQGMARRRLGTYPPSFHPASGQCRPPGIRHAGSASGIQDPADKELRGF